MIRGRGRGSGCSGRRLGRGSGDSDRRWRRGSGCSGRRLGRGSGRSDWLLRRGSGDSGRRLGRGSGCSGRRLGRGSGGSGRRFPFGPEAQGDERHRIEFAGCLELLILLVAFEGGGPLRAPDSVGRLRAVALGDHRLLDLLVALGRGRRLPQALGLATAPARRSRGPAAFLRGLRGGLSSRRLLSNRPLLRGSGGVGRAVLPGLDRETRPGQTENQKQRGYDPQTVLLNRSVTVAAR